MEPKSRGVFINGKARISNFPSNKTAKVSDLLKVKKNMIKKSN